MFKILYHISTTEAVSTVHSILNKVLFLEIYNLQECCINACVTHN